MAKEIAGEPGGEPGDALEVIEVQDQMIDQLLRSWTEETEDLRQGDSVDRRWERGSVVKLLLQHLAVREEAKQEVASRLSQAGHDELAQRLEGDGVRRRQAIASLEEAVRGRPAITLNTPEVDLKIIAIRELLETEAEPERGEVLPATREALGPAGQRDLPSARYVRTHSPTHPSPTPRWYDKIGPLKAWRALYEHLRGSPSGGTAPSVDAAREHTPGMRP